MKKTMTPREFQEQGYLQELNRKFLHPLGLALAISVDNDDPTKDCFGPVLDNRDDEEGWIFGDRPELRNIRRARADHVQEQWDARKLSREDSLGFMIEPV
jgi:hypothetical protein